MKKSLSIAVFSGLLFLGGCAPGLGKTITVTRFPESAKMVRHRGELGRMLVKPFVDGRSDQTMVTVDGRSVDADGDVGNAVRGMVESYLKEAGFTAGTVAVPGISGIVDRWSAEVFPGFPSSRVEASAAVTLTVTDASGAEKFRGTYRGTYSVEHPLIDEDKIAEALGESMAAAVQEALMDPRVTVPLSAAGG